MKKNYMILIYADRDKKNQIGKPAYRKTERGFREYASKAFDRYYEKYQDLTVVIYEEIKGLQGYTTNLKVSEYHA